MPRNAAAYPRNDVSRVLIYRLGSLGDNIVALPCYHGIARAFPNAERRLLTNIPVHSKAPAAAAVIGGSGLIHDYIDYPVGTRRLREILEVGTRIAKFRPQVLVYLAALRGPGSVRRDKLFFHLCGISEIIGLPQSAADFERRQLPGSARLESEALRLGRSIRAIGEPDQGDPENWDLRLTPAENGKADTITGGHGGAPFLAVSLGTKAQANDWGEANWTALLTRLAELLPEHRLVLLGAADESELCARSAVAWKRRSLNLCGQLTPRESAALLVSAKLFLGHDSGPMHLASAVGTPCVAIFSARNLPGIWFPRGAHNTVIYHQTDCAGCGLTTCIEQRKRCILSITVDEVISAVMAGLEAIAKWTSPAAYTGTQSCTAPSSQLLPPAG